MAVPLRQSLRIASYLARQSLRDGRSSLSSSSSSRCSMQPRLLRLRQDPAPRPRAAPAPMPVDQASARSRSAARRWCSIAGGEPLIHPEIDAIVRRARRTQEVRLPVHERAADGEASSTSSRRRRTSPGPCTSTACASATTRRSSREGVFDKAVAAIQAAKERGLPRHHQHARSSPHDSPEDGARRPRLPQRRARGRRDDDLAGLRLREGARPGPLPRRRADPRAVPRRRSPTAAASGGGSTTRRCSSTSSRARSTSSARRGGSRATRCSAGSGPAT